jgi:hypothetical protein
MTRRLKWLIAVAVLLALAAGGAAAWAQARENRAARLAVKYGFAPSKEEATLSDRCAGVMLYDFERTDPADRAGVGEDTLRVLAPRVCALGVSRGLVSDDGTMSEESGFRLTTDVVDQMGPARFQTLLYDELAVDYGLARPGKTTRWHRCVAMAIGGWEAARRDGASMPPKADWERAARLGCTEGVKRGLVPASGAPEVDSPEAAELFVLICARARDAGSCA